MSSCESGEGQGGDWKEDRSELVKGKRPEMRRRDQDEKTNKGKRDDETKQREQTTKSEGKKAVQVWYC